ncbi:MAG TPA: DUF2398 family protein, partial [Polyangia bacterium]|nr:DUF2398 family protein [Polyangia bacterium]
MMNDDAPAGHELTRAERAERQSALRTLLRRPLLHPAADRDAFALVRRHRTWLQEWLARHTGWLLTVDADLARLRKLPPELSDGSRAAREPKHG